MADEIDETAPYAGFEGRVGRTFAGVRGLVAAATDGAGRRAQHRRHARRRPRLRRPRLLRLRDRHAATSTALAARGPPLHRTSTSTPMCSPTRAALLTGLEPAHAPASARVAHTDPGFPGYAMELADERGDDGRDPARQRLRHAAWSASGTWPRTPTSSAPGPKHSWPLPARASTATTASSTRSPTSTTRTGSSRTTTRSRSTSTPTATTSPTTSPTAPSR